jgi:predicted glycosyltransferase
MRILFFIVHPSKYYLFRHAIRRLKSEGHEVDIAIVTKDVLEPLIQQEGWAYTNILPEGRRSNRLPPKIAMGYFLVKTLWGLWRYTSGKKYDLFITDDVLTIIGKLRGVKSLFFLDDDYELIKEVYPILACANSIASPECTNVGPFVTKKSAYRGYHELAYLSPAYFTPDKGKTKQFNPEGGKYSILRLVSLTASHDKGKKGISNEKVSELIRVLEEHGKVFITSERALPEQFEKYRIKINPQDIAHALYFAEIFVGDSQTMTSEAAVLGTPALRCNDFVGLISTMEEREEKYGLTHGYKPVNFDQLIAKARELLSMPNLKEEYRKRAAVMLNECEDVNEVILREILKFKPAA